MYFGFPMADRPIHGVVHPRPERTRLQGHIQCSYGFHGPGGDISDATDLSVFGARGVADRPLARSVALRGLLASPRVLNGTPVETGLPFSTRGLSCGPTRFMLIIGRSYKDKISQSPISCISAARDPGMSLCVGERYDMSVPQNDMH